MSADETLAKIETVANIWITLSHRSSPVNIPGLKGILILSLNASTDGGWRDYGLEAINEVVLQVYLVGHNTHTERGGESMCGHFYPIFPLYQTTAYNHFLDNTNNIY